MGGHGGLNILPQKRWNVYNFDNREKVRKDEEAAAREEQLKREESRRRDFELRLQTLRQARSGAHPRNPNPNPSSPPSTSDSNHINLFENVEGFSFLGSKKEGSKAEEADGGEKNNRKRKEAPSKAKEKVVVTAEDEKYRLGYGLMGKGVKAPWYLSKREDFGDDGDEEKERRSPEKKKGSGGSGRKSIEELRAERIRREGKEKERERALILAAKRKDTDRGFSRRRM